VISIHVQKVPTFTARLTEIPIAAPATVPLVVVAIVRRQEAPPASAANFRNPRSPLPCSDRPAIAVDLAVG